MNESKIPPLEDVADRRDVSQQNVKSRIRTTHARVSQKESQKKRFKIIPLLFNELRRSAAVSRHSDFKQFQFGKTENKRRAAGQHEHPFGRPGQAEPAAEQGNRHAVKT